MRLKFTGDKEKYLGYIPVEKIDGTVKKLRKVLTIDMYYGILFLGIRVLPTIVYDRGYYDD